MSVPGPTTDIDQRFSQKEKSPCGGRSNPNGKPTKPVETRSLTYADTP
jgi:hypothetical protein